MIGYKRFISFKYYKHVTPLYNFPQNTILFPLINISTFIKKLNFKISCILEYINVIVLLYSCDVYLCVEENLY